MTDAADATVRRKHPWVRRVLIGLLALVALLVVAAGAGWAWLHGDAGRRYLARRIESFINQEIRGRVAIGSITRLSRRGVIARDLRFLAPGGEEVIVVRDVELEVRWSAALHGQFVSPWARARGGRVVLHERGDALTIDTTFQGRPDPTRRPSPPRPGPRPSSVVFQRIEVSDVTLITAVGGVPDARVSDIRTVLAIDVRQPGGRPLLTLDGLSGGAHLDTPLPIRMTFTGGTFRYDSGNRDRARADVTARLGDNLVRLRCRATVRSDGAHVSLRLKLPESAGPLDALPTIAQAGVASLASSHFEFSVDRD